MPRSTNRSPDKQNIEDFKKKVAELRRWQAAEIVKAIKPVVTKAEKVEKLIKEIQKRDLPKETTAALLEKLKKSGLFVIAKSTNKAMEYQTMLKKIDDAIKELDDGDQKAAKKIKADLVKDFGKESKETKIALDRFSHMARAAVIDGTGGTDFMGGCVIVVAGVAEALKRWKNKK